MDVEDRRTKKRREAERLRGLAPEESLRMGFSLARFGRRLREAAERARR